MVDMAAVSRRVLGTLERDTSLKARVRQFRWGNAPIFDYAGSKPLVYVAPSIAPVVRSDAGSGTDPNRHPPQLVKAAVEVIIVTEAKASPGAAQAQVWELAELAEHALGKNSMLKDADMANPMAASLRISTYNRRGPQVGGPVEALTVLVMATLYDWPGTSIISPPPGAA